MNGRLLVVIAALIWGVLYPQTLHGQSQISAPDLNERELEMTLDSLAAEVMQDWSVPGLAVSIVSGERTLLLKGYGYENLETRAPVHPRSVFHVASVSKPFTAMGVLQLVERGSLRLDEDVRQYLRQPIPVLRNSGRSPTVGDLLVHAGGLDLRNINRKCRTVSCMEDLGTYLRKNLPPVIHDPGAVSVYSNHGYALLGHLVSEVTGQPFHRYMKEHVFSPLEMNDTYFFHPESSDTAMIQGHAWSSGGMSATAPDLIQTVPASMLRTSAADMTNWMKAMLSHGSHLQTQVLDSALAERMLSRQFTHHPLLSGRSLGLSEGNRFSPPAFLHSGGARGFTSAVLLYPEGNFGIFIAANNSMNPWGLINRVLDRFPDRPEEAPPAASPGTVSGFTEGYYREAAIPQSTMYKLGNAIYQVRITTDDANRLYLNGSPYEPLDSLTYRHASNGSILALSESGNAKYVFISGNTYVRIPAFQSRTLQSTLWGVFIILFAGIPLFLAFRHLRDREQPAGGRWLIVASLLNLCFVSGIAYLLYMELGDAGVLPYGIPIWFQALRLGLAVSAVCTLISLWLYATENSEDSPLWKRTIGYVLHLLILGFYPFTAYWNLW